MTPPKIFIIPPETSCIMILEFQLLPSLGEEFLYKRYFDGVQLVAATFEETKKI